MENSLCIICNTNPNYDDGLCNSCHNEYLEGKLSLNKITNHKKYQEFLNEIKKEWDLTPAQHDFIVVHRNLNWLKDNEVKLISKNVFNNTGVTFKKTDNYEFKTIIEDETEDFYLYTLKLTTHDNNNIFLILDDMFYMADLFYDFRKSLKDDNNDIKEFLKNFEIAIDYYEHILQGGRNEKTDS